MVDTIGTSTSLLPQRTQASLQTSRLRSADVLTAVQQADQRASGAASAMKVFSVADAAKAGGAHAKLPRGSLVDILA